MEWVKCSERLPDQPGEYLFRYKQHGDRTAYFVKGASKEDFKNHIKWVNNPLIHEWLDESSSPTALLKEEGWVKVPAEFIFEFDSFQEWVSKARSWFKPYRDGECFCLDKNGNRCFIGEDFMKADELGLFPVKVYRMKRTIDLLPALPESLIK